MPAANPFVSPQWAAPMEPPAQRLEYVSRPPEWQSGIVAPRRPLSAASDAGVLTLVLAMLVFVGFNTRYVRRLISNLPNDLWSLRRRNNAFDDHTANEMRTTLLLVLQLCVFQGVLLWMWLGDPLERWDFRPVFPAVGCLSALMCGWYAFSISAYATLGYTFSDRLGTAQFVRGFNASQVSLSLLLALPALVALFYPALAEWMLWAAAGLYVLTRGAFIIKGFRIFYVNFSSWLYFILYLCTLEIVPVLAVLATATAICV